MIFSFRRLVPLLAALFTSILVLLSVVWDGAEPVRENAAVVQQKTQGFLELPKPPEDPIIVPGNSPFPELNAHAYLVRLVGSTQVFAKRREFKPVPPASLIKLLTAVIAQESLPKTIWITFSEDARNVEEKRSNALTGEAFLRDDTLRLVLIESANDAARAISETVAGGAGTTFQERLEAFAALMNEKAKNLGMKNSVFSNPTGLDPESSDEPQYSTAEDLARLAEYIEYEHPRLWEISRTAETVVYSDASKEYRIKNTNELLGEFPGILGGKTGFTDEARGTLIFLYPFRSDRVAIVVLLGSEDRFGDGRKVIQWLETIAP